MADPDENHYRRGGTQGGSAISRAVRPRLYREDAADDRAVPKPGRNRGGNEPWPGVPDVDTLARAIRLAPSRWVGRCAEIAAMLNAVFRLGYEERYGFWAGKVDPASPFFGRPRGMVRHGWLEAPDGRVVDPTRWAFEGKPPYIFVGPPRKDYDAGMRGFKLSLPRLGPPPFDPADGPTEYAWKDPVAAALVMTLFGRTSPLSTRQAAYLANTPAPVLGPSAGPIFRAIAAAGHRAYVPIDEQEEFLPPRDPGATPGARE